jgi:hypothetical protein
LARRTSMRAAPLATPRTSPKIRNAASLAVKIRLSLLGRPSAARPPRQRSCA